MKLFATAITLTCVLSTFTYSTENQSSAEVDNRITLGQFVEGTKPINKFPTLQALCRQEIFKQFASEAKEGCYENLLKLRDSDFYPEPAQQIIFPPNSFYAVRDSFCDINFLGCMEGICLSPKWPTLITATPTKKHVENYWVLNQIFPLGIIENIISFHCQTNTISYFFRQLSLSKDLKTLKIPLPHKAFGPDLGSLKNFTNLTSLTLSHCEINKEISFSLTNLTDLTLGNGQNIWFSDAQNLVRFCSRLTKLRISNFSLKEDLNFTLPHLTSLSMIDTTPLDKSVNILLNCPNLSELDLRDSYLDPNLSDVFAHLQELRSLHCLDVSSSFIAVTFKLSVF